MPLCFYVFFFFHWQPCYKEHPHRRATTDPINQSINQCYKPPEGATPHRANKRRKGPRAHESTQEHKSKSDSALPSESKAQWSQQLEAKCNTQVRQPGLPHTRCTHVWSLLPKPALTPNTAQRAKDTHTHTHTRPGHDIKLPLAQCCCVRDLMVCRFGFGCDWFCPFGSYRSYVGCLLVIVKKTKTHTQAQRTHKPARHANRGLRGPKAHQGTQNKGQTHKTHYSLSDSNMSRPGRASPSPRSTELSPSLLLRVSRTTPTWSLSLLLRESKATTHCPVGALSRAPTNCHTNLLRLLESWARKLARAPAS